MERLKYILDFFKGSSTFLSLFVIPFDWRMDIGELEVETRLLAGHIDNYTPNILVSPALLGQILKRSEGSHFAKQGMSELDFFRYERDPRCLMLAMLVKTKINQLYALDVEGINNSPEMHNYVSIKILRGLIDCIDQLKAVPAERFDIDKILKVMEGAGEAKNILNAFYAQLPRGERNRFRSKFDAAFVKQFPELAPAQKKGLFKKLFA